MCGTFCTSTAESETLPMQPTSSENKALQPQTSRVPRETFQGQGTYMLVLPWMVVVKHIYL